MSEELTVKAVNERISGLKGFLRLSVGLLTNRIGHCKCTRANPCIECKEDESFIRVIEQVLKGGKE